jgi:hypothetical protein
MNFRRAFAVLGALALTASFTTGSYAQDKNEGQRKLSGDERKEYVALSELVDAVVAGKKPAPADVKLKFQNHFLKAGDQVYIPYHLEMTGGTFTSFPVTMYVRAVKNAPAGATPAAAAKGGEKPAEFPFADVYFLNEKNLVATGDVTQIPRALMLAPGDYTLYVAMREKQPRDRKVAPKAVVLTQPLSVPDLNTALTTSTIILAKSLDPAPEQLTPQQQLEQPFTISGYRMSPSFSSSIPQAGELLFVFVIYNEGVAASGKPDLDVEYNFFRAAEDKPFTKLATQSFNATTLPSQFDMKLGHQVFVGQGIPLKSPQMTFAPGDYRLEIKITDKTNSQTIMRNVPFTVS